MAASTITAIPEDIILTHILPHLDGPSLASFACASSSLRLLCTQQSLWTNICNTTWPSTTTPLLRDLISTYPPHGPRSFFADAFPLPSPTSHDYYPLIPRPSRPDRLISAVDIHYKKKCFFSKVIETDTLWPDFESTTPFHVQIVRPTNEFLILIPLHDDDIIAEDLAEDLKLNWIVVDPFMQFRALNVSCGRPVSITSSKSVSVSVHPRRRLSQENISLTYARVMSAGRRRRGGGGSGDEELAVQCKVAMKCTAGQWRRGRGGDQMKVIRVKWVSFMMKYT